MSSFSGNPNTQLRPINPTPSVSNRLNELLDGIRMEFEMATKGSSPRDEQEQKLFQSQVKEIMQMQQMFNELERSHRRMKFQYEEEISILRKELENRGIPVPNVKNRKLDNTESSDTLFTSNTVGTSAHREANASNGNWNQNSSNTELKNADNFASKNKSVNQMAHSGASQIFYGIENSAIPAEYKKEGSDWIAFFNPNVPRSLDLSLSNSTEHPSVVCCTKFSLDGKYLATGCNRLTQIFNVENGALIASLSEKVDQNVDLYIRSVCFSPDGTKLAAGAEDNKVRVWDIASKRIVTTLEGHSQDIYSLDFSRDGKFIVSGSGDKSVKIWSVETGECMNSLMEDKPEAKDSGVTSVCVSHDSKYVASGSLDRYIRIWEVSTGRLVSKTEGHHDSIYSVVYSPNGNLLASGSLDKTLKVWDISDPEKNPLKCLTTYSDHKDFVLSVAFSADSKYVLSGSKDRSVRLWDLQNEKCAFVLQGHKNSVISVSASPTNPIFATGSGDKSVKLWNMSNHMEYSPKNEDVSMKE